MTIRNLIKKEEACGAEHTAEKRKGLKKPRHPKRWLALLLVILFAVVPIVMAVAPIEPLEEMIAASRLAPLFDSDLILAIIRGGL